MTTSGGTRAASAATSRQVKQKLVNLLFGKELRRTGPEGHRKLDYSIYNYDDLKKAYLERLHVLHPDKLRRVPATATAAGSTSDNKQTIEVEDDPKQEFLQLQDVWAKYDEMARSVMKITGGDGGNANFTKFGVGCSFSDNDAERALRNDITDQACRGWFSSGLLPEQGTADDEDASQAGNAPGFSATPSLIDDDLFVEATATPSKQKSSYQGRDKGDRKRSTSTPTLIPMPKLASSRASYEGRRWISNLHPFPMGINSFTASPTVRVHATVRSFISTATPFSDGDADVPSPLCDVVQGPSLLRTPVSRPHPSLVYLPGLRSLPFWTSQEGGDDGKSKQIAYNDPTVRYVVQYLESHLDTIREEYLRVAPTLPSDYDESMGGHSKDTLHSGTWEWHSYMNKGGIQGHFCTHFPKTSEILHQGLRQRTEANGGLVPGCGKESGEEHLYPHLLFEGTPFGFCFLSTLSGKSKIQAHTAPMNLRLRLHVPLIVPSDTANGSDRPACGIRVGPFVREWKEGSVMVLDDAYNHEVWNDTDEARVILLVDIWHPDIPAVEKKAIVDLFQKAQKEGLWKR